MHQIVQKMSRCPESLHQVTSLSRHPVRIHPVPFDVAADEIGQRHTHRRTSQVLFQSPFQIIGRHLIRDPWIVAAASGIDEFAIAVEDGKVRCSQELPFVGLSCTSRTDEDTLVLDRAQGV